MIYFLFIAKNCRFLAFGLLVALFSSFGQTYFIGLFSGEIQVSLNLSHGDFGLTYSCATLASGTLLFWLGGLIDRIDLRLWVTSLAILAVIACIIMKVSPTVVVLAISLFLLRLGCQGLLTHTYMTSMARYFEKDRGKAISIAMLGHPIGEAIFPLLTVTLIAVIGWRDAWLVYAAVGALIFYPLLLWLLRGHSERHQRYLLRLEKSSTLAPEKGHQWTKSEVIRDIRFYLIQIAMMAPPFIVTGLFVHQVHLVQAKGWSITWFATCFVFYAITSIASSLVSGPLVDRIGARRVAPHALVPAIASMLVLALFDHPIAGLIFMGSLGMCIGIVFTAFTAVWPELYGVRYLGSIRSMVMAIMILTSAIAPALLGWLFDLNVDVETVAYVFAMWTFVGWVLLLFLLGRSRRNGSNNLLGESNH